MREQPQRLAGSVLATVLCAALLLPGSVAAAGKRPSLAATAQYKAFIEYVKKLDGLVGQATSSAQKDTYQSELTAKLEAATHKANALFNRGSDKAEAEANAKFKQQQASIRGAEGEETEALEAEFAARLRKAATSFREKVLRVETGTGTSKPRSINRSPPCAARRPPPPTSPPKTRSRNGSPPRSPNCKPGARKRARSAPS